MLLEDRVKPRRPRMPGIARELVVDGQEVEHAHAVRLVECPLDCPSRQDRGEVEDRPRDRRRRDVVLLGGVVGREGG
jgi:hypothetical protein